MKFELLHYRGSHYKDLSRKAVLPHGMFLPMSHSSPELCTGHGV